MIGTVISYRGTYGFIEANDRAFFVHLSNVCDQRVLKAGQLVEFETQPSTHKPGTIEAVNVRVIGQAANSAVGGYADGRS